MHLVEKNKYRCRRNDEKTIRGWIQEEEGGGEVMGARAKVGYRRSTWFFPSSKIFDSWENIE